ncbi:MAG TPA: 50S ribosomal protein L4 [Patescibacteria group bacterium]|nr:50S ribosomal protein L4 [Patescibacteria group bacterium]
MSEAAIYNQTGKKVGQQKLSDSLFGLKVNPSLVHEAVVAMQANARRATAHTKTRGEVSGGGIKPWKQKGTGRARQGSIRSPLWKGGGVTFGPRNDRNYSKKMNKQSRQNVLRMALSDKAVNGAISVMEDLKLEKGKTKEVAAVLKAIGAQFPVLMITIKGDTAIRRASQNIDRVHVNQSNNLHLGDILLAKTIVVSATALKEVELQHAKVKSE